MDWVNDDRIHGTALFVYLTVQIQNLMANKEVSFVSTHPAVAYIKFGRK